MCRLMFKNRFNLRKVVAIAICFAYSVTVFAQKEISVEINVIDNVEYESNHGIRKEVHRKTSKRKSSIEKPTNQSTISYVALNDKDPAVRKLALEKSTNQSTISYVALNDKDPAIRKVALEKSTNQSTISYVALNDKDPVIRKFALEKIK